MSRRVGGFMRGIGIGVAAGCVAGAVGSMYVNTNRKGLKKNIGKALRNVGDLMDDVTGMF